MTDAAKSVGFVGFVIIQNTTNPTLSMNAAIIFAKSKPIDSIDHWLQTERAGIIANSCGLQIKRDKLKCQESKP